MSKQTSVELPNVTAENPVGQSVAGKRKRGGPKKATAASLDGREGLCDGKSSDVERKRSRLGQILTLPELLTEDVGCFTITPAVTIVDLNMHRYSYHRCVDCWKKAVQNTEGKYCCVQHPKKETEEIYRLRVLLRQGDLNMWVTAFDEVAEEIVGITVKKFSAFDDDGRKKKKKKKKKKKLYLTPNRQMYNASQYHKITAIYTHAHTWTHVHRHSS